MSIKLNLESFYMKGATMTKDMTTGNPVKLILLFSIGSLLATLIFLSFIGFIGSLSNNFLNKNVLSILNLSVGLTLVYFGIKKIKK